MKKLLTLLLLVSSCAFGGTVTGQITTATSGPIINGTLTLTPTQAFVVSGTATVVSTAVNCYTDAFGNVVGEPNPLVAPVVATNTGSGTLAAGTYFTRFAYQDATGTTFYSFETTTVLSSTGSLIVSAPVRQPSGSTGYKVFISTSSSTETLQGTVTGTPGTWANYTQSVPLVSGAALPSTNTTACKPYFSDEGIPVFSYLVGLSNSSGSNVSGFPQRWRLFGGSAGTVNLSLGMPLSDGVVIYPQPIVTTPAFNAMQSINGPLNLNGYALLGVGALSGSFAGPSPWIDPTAVPYSCKGDGTTDDNVCFQSAITAANAVYGRLFLPPGKKFFIGCTGASPCLSSSRAIEIFGGNNFASQLIVPTAIANTKRLLTLLNDGTDGYYLHDFSIVCQGGTCNPLALINLDVTTNGIARMNMARVEELGTYGTSTCGLSLVNPANANGFYDSNIGPLNVIANGSASSCFQRIGDDVKFIDNTFVGTGTGLNVSCVPGALGLDVRHNTFVNNTAAIKLGDGCSGVRIHENQLEGNAGVTGSNGAYLDVDCTTGNPCVDVQIYNNHKIAAVAAGINNIRLNWARAGQISNNALFRAGGGAVDVITTANNDPASSILWPNDYEPNPDTQANVVNDTLSVLTKVWGFPQSQAANGGISAGMDFSRPIGMSQQLTFAAGQGIGSAAGGGPFVVPSLTTPGNLVGTSAVQVLSNKSTAAGALTGTVGSGTASMTTTGIGTGACGSTVTVAATGVLTTDVINATRNAAATIGNGGGLTLNAWPTAGNVNFNYCNSAAGTITPTAMTVNWSVVR